MTHTGQISLSQTMCLVLLLVHLQDQFSIFYSLHVVSHVLIEDHIYRFSHFLEF